MTYYKRILYKEEKVVILAKEIESHLKKNQEKKLKNKNHGDVDLKFIERYARIRAHRILQQQAFSETYIGRALASFMDQALKNAGTATSGMFSMVEKCLKKIEELHIKISEIERKQEEGRAAVDAVLTAVTEMHHQQAARADAEMHRREEEHAAAMAEMRRQEEARAAAMEEMHRREETRAAMAEMHRREEARTADEMRRREEQQLQIALDNYIQMVANFTPRSEHAAQAVIGFTNAIHNLIGESYNIEGVYFWIEHHPTNGRYYLFCNDYEKIRAVSSDSIVLEPFTMTTAGGGTRTYLKCDAIEAGLKHLYDNPGAMPIFQKPIKSLPTDPSDDSETEEDDYE